MVLLLLLLMVRYMNHVGLSVSYSWSSLAPVVSYAHICIPSIHGNLLHDIMHHSDIHFFRPDIIIALYLKPSAILEHCAVVTSVEVFRGDYYVGVVYDVCIFL